GVADLVAERYELLEVLGQGGDSEVVQAVDRRHDRLVALKWTTTRTPSATSKTLSRRANACALRRTSRARQATTRACCSPAAVPATSSAPPSSSGARARSRKTSG